MMATKLSMKSGKATGCWGGSCKRYLQEALSGGSCCLGDALYGNVAKLRNVVCIPGQVSRFAAPQCSISRPNGGDVGAIGLKHNRIKGKLRQQPAQVVGTIVRHGSAKTKGETVVDEIGCLG